MMTCAFCPLLRNNTYITCYWSNCTNTRIVSLVCLCMCVLMSLSLHISILTSHLLMSYTVNFFPLFLPFSLPLYLFLSVSLNPPPPTSHLSSFFYLSLPPFCTLSHSLTWSILESSRCSSPSAVRSSDTTRPTDPRRKQSPSFMGNGNPVLFLSPRITHVPVFMYAILDEIRQDKIR